MRTNIDLDDEACEAAARELGTATKRDTVNAALAYVAGRGKRVSALIEDRDRDYLFGGPDIDNPEIMKGARR